MSFMASRVSDETFRLVIFFSDWTWFSAMMRHSNQQRAWLRHAVRLGTNTRPLLSCVRPAIGEF